MGEKKRRPEGIKIGEQRGIQKERRTIIGQLLTSGMDKPAVAKVIKISLQALENIIAVH